MALLGRELIIARSDGSGGFVPHCITEQRSLEINNEEVDITKPDCAAPGGKLHASFMYGIQSIRFQGQGAFVDSTEQKTALANAINQVTEAYQITIPGVGTIEGDALLSMTLSGDKTGEMQKDIRFVMTGAVEFEAEA
jgi:predicted secreted protein